MQIVYAPQDPPDAWTKSIFLAGPTPRARRPVPSWRPEAIETLRRRGFDGVVFVPEQEDGQFHDDYLKQVQWEDWGLNVADLIVFWVPRDLDTLPAFTTNVEFGRWIDSHKVVLGFPPDAPKNRYLDAVYRKVSGRAAHTNLGDTLADAVGRLGDGAYRAGGARTVPLYVWRSRFFSSWYADLERAGHRLDDARVRWVDCRPEDQQVFAGVVWTKVWVEAEQRHKDNEWIFGRTDISSTVLHSRSQSAAPTMDDLLRTEVVLIREFRAPGRTVDGFVVEPPGGSTDDGGSPRDVAAQEVRQETGLDLAPERLRAIERRSAAAAVSTHHIHLHVAELSDEEMEVARSAAQRRVVRGVDSESERTTVEVATIDALLRTNKVDWSTLGMLLRVMYERHVASSGQRERP